MRALSASVASGRRVPLPKMRSVLSLWWFAKHAVEPQISRVGPEHPVRISAGGFLWSALRTGLATLTASGSPQSHACDTTNEPNLFVHGVGILEPR